MVPQKLRDLEVRVLGRGGTRTADALWPAQDASAEIPTQIKSIEDDDAGANSASSAKFEK